MTRVASDIWLLPVFAADELPLMRDGFDAAARSFPEFNQAAFGPNDVYVLGAFGAFGNPGSFHNPWVRALRQRIHPVAREALRNVAQPGELFHQLFDRMCLRKAGTAYSGEGWHRDVCFGLNSLPSDKIFGGWVNLDNSPQLFHAVPNSAERVGQGFAIEEQPAPEEQRSVVVPSGWMVLFRQDILHSVAKVRNSQNSYRQFVGFRLTTSDQPLYDVAKIVEEQAVPRLPSGQEPALFSKNHNSALLHRITVPWSDRLLNEIVKQPRLLQGSSARRIHSMVPRVLRHGLRHYGAMYPGYTQQEVEVLIPHAI